MQLSEAEMSVAEQYCHGLTDKEVASSLGKPVWTVRTHKKHIYKKLSIATTHELVLYMVALFIGKEWDIKELRRRGLAALLLSLFCMFMVLENECDFIRSRRIRIECRESEARNEWT